MGGNQSQRSMGSNDSKGNEEPLQHLVTEVSQEDDDWRKVKKLLELRMREKHRRHYRYQMEMRRLFRLELSQTLQSYSEQAKTTPGGKPKQLFHGTTPRSAERIILSGFELPQTPGMFGRGIYFAKDPLKSVRYARAATRPNEITARPEEMQASSNFMTRLGNLIFQSNVQRETVRHMLLCDVYLGKSRTFRLARPKFEPATGLQRNRLLRLFGASKYDSIRAPGGAFGAVRVTEYVIYNKHQAIPRFLIEFEQAAYDVLSL